MVFVIMHAQLGLSAAYVTINGNGKERRIIPRGMDETEIAAESEIAEQIGRPKFQPYWFNSTAVHASYLSQRQRCRRRSKVIPNQL
jgi:hypothetical protein